MYIVLSTEYTVIWSIFMQPIHTKIYVYNFAQNLIAEAL